MKKKLQSLPLFVVTMRFNVRRAIWLVRDENAESASDRALSRARYHHKFPLVVEKSEMAEAARLCHPSAVEVYYE